jgi:RimJ/RimL family protein N-acetyltransferase
MATPTDIELLRIQGEASFDRRGRVIGLDGIRVVCTVDRRELWIGAEVPDALATELTSLFESAAASDPSAPPPALEPSRRILETDGRSLRRVAGPRFLIAEGAHFSSDVHLERSDASSGDALRNANPGGWHSVEWDELLDGSLGPWTMAIEAGQVVSICHTPRPLTARAAECGVWTHPGFRGRGYAAAVTSEWAAMLRSSGRHLFYSTDLENLSSQRVARRLSLRLLGWTWQLGVARDDEEDRLHPLSTLRRRR